MSELRIEIPGLLEEETKKIEKQVEELISLEEKRKLLSLFINEVMKDTGQLTADELVNLGRQVKKGRFEKLRRMGLA